MFLARIVVSLPCALLVSSLSAEDPRPIPPAQFEKTFELIKRHEGEWKWAELPWVINFADAQRKSLAQGKPIFAVITAQGCVAGFV